MAEDPEAKRAQGCETDAKESEYKQRIDIRRVRSERRKVETAESCKERIAERRRFRCLTSIIYERVARVLSPVCRYSARPRKKEMFLYLRRLQILGVLSAQRSICRNCRRKPYERPITE